MNQDNINNIQNAIDYLRSAKTDKNKELITYAIDYINKAINGLKNEVVENEVPYISTYYIKPIVKPDEDVIIDYYITDWNRKDIVNNDFSEMFTVTVRVEGRDEIKIPFLKAGNHSVNIGSFNDFVEEFYNVIGFVNDSPITTFNPEKIFESFEIEDIYRQYEVDIYDIVEDLDYLVTKTGSLYENDSYKSTPNKEFIKILEKCKYDDYIIIIIGND